MRQTYGKQLPGMRLTDLPGKLIVIEGTDGAGRSTQIKLLKPWLEELGHAVLDTGMTRSRLAGDGIRRAKEALAYLVMVKETLGDDWLTSALFRFGASTLLNDVLMQLVKVADGNYQSADYFSLP